MSFLWIFVLILLLIGAVWFFWSFFPFILLLLVIWWIYRLFRPARPKSTIYFYSTDFTQNPEGQNPASSSKPKQIPDDIIDAEYTESEIDS